MYRSPAFDYERDRENTAMLTGDVRRMMRIGIAIVLGLAIALMATGGVKAGLNLMLLGGGPLVIIAAVGELLGRRARRGDGT